MKRKMLLVLMAFVFLCLSPCNVFGFPVSDDGRLGSITVELICEDAPVSGGTLALYYLGQIVQAEDGDLIVVPTEDFAMLEGISVGELLPQFAQKLEQYVSEKALSGDLRDVDTDERATFPDLKAGLYFVMQPVEAEGYERMNPFLITVPLLQDDALVFEIIAHPKVKPKPEETQPQVPTEPEPTKPTEPSKPSLPQTGQLNWPIPLMGSLGTCLLAVGGILCFRRKRDEDET